MENKKIKMYVNMEDLSEYEKEHNRISYRRLIDRISNGVWLFNKALELSDYCIDYEVNSDYDEENDVYIDIYQQYLIDIDNYMIEKLNDINCNDVIIAYSNTLEEYILLVDHYGTSWDYVLTDIEPTNNLDESDL